MIISHEHGSALEDKRARTFLDRHVVARGSDMILAVSSWDRNQLIEIERIAPERIRVFRNAIETLAATGADVRAEFGVTSDQRLIGAVGRLVAEKRQADLIRAVALLKAQGRAVCCLLVGDGPDAGALRSLARDLDVAAEVRLAGNRSDVPDVLAALDVAVLASVREGAPLALLEYMGAAAPIVATAVGGVPELITDSVHGLLVKPRDPQALASAIARLLDDEKFARRLGDAARERQQAEFTLDVAVARIEQLYEELFDASRRRSPRRSD